MQTQALTGFVAEVTGIDLAAAPSARALGELQAVLELWPVVVLRGQALTDEAQIAVGRAFGEIEPATRNVITRERRISAELSDISNLDHTGARLDHADRRSLFNLGNQIWHSDSSFMALPAKFSMLSARVVPTAPADTQYADMTAAYEALDAETRTEIDGLVWRHSLMFSRQQLGFLDYTAEEQERFAPVTHPLVRRNPATGRRSLFLSAHAGEIVGWPTPRARLLLRHLVEHATQPRFVHTHQWRVHDLVIWDNRRTMHRGAWYWDRGEVRDMRRTTLVGEPAVAG